MDMNGQVPLRPFNFNAMSNNVMAYMTSFIVSGGAGSNGGLNYNMIITCLLVMMVTWAFTGIKNILEFLFDLIIGRFYYTVKLASPDQVYNDFMEWVAVQRTFGTKGVNALKRPQFGNQLNKPTTGGKRSNLNLTLVPTGTQFFFYSRYLVSMSRTCERNTGQEFIDINIYGGGLSAIKKLLQTVHEHCVEQNKDKTQIYNLASTMRSWELVSNQPGRPFDSVILEADVKDKLINDFETFINDSQWYRNAGVPYRRGYILHGPPGCGKTSFILALAHRFEKNIGVINMNKEIDDNSITSIIQKVPAGSILVMEDIDAAFTKKENAKIGGLTFAGLLNAIDGLASSDGRILIMTTNHLDRLQPALIRPGRVDVIVEFKYATHNQISQMFKRFFEEYNHHYLKSILEVIPEHAVSISQIQGWFIIHRSSPEKMVETIEKYFQGKHGDYTNTYDSQSSTPTTTTTTPPPLTTTPPSSTDTTPSPSPSTSSPIIEHKNQPTDLPTGITKRINTLKADVN